MVKGEDHLPKWVKDRYKKKNIYSTIAFLITLLSLILIIYSINEIQIGETGGYFYLVVGLVALLNYNNITIKIIRSKKLHASKQLSYYLYIISRNLKNNEDTSKYQRYIYAAETILSNQISEIEKIIPLEHYLNNFKSLKNVLNNIRNKKLDDNRRKKISNKIFYIAKVLDQGGALFGSLEYIIKEIDKEFEKEENMLNRAKTMFYRTFSYLKEHKPLTAIIFNITIIIISMLLVFFIDLSIEGAVVMIGTAMISTFIKMVI